MNAATVSIQTEGAKVRIHICEGANTYFKNNLSKIFSCIRASANTGPACIRAKINSPRIISCMYWLCAGGYFGVAPLTLTLTTRRISVLELFVGHSWL